MKNFDLSKIAFYLSCFLLTFAYGVLAGAYPIFPHSILTYIKDRAVLVFQEWNTLTKTKPEHYLHPARYQGSGVIMNKVTKDPGEFVLLQGFFRKGFELRLIKLDGTLVARWPVNYSELVKHTGHLRDAPTTDWNVESMGAVALPDGSVVFNVGGIGLVKLDRCRNLVWSVVAPTHHSVTLNADGSFWVPAADNIYKNMQTPYPLFKPPFSADKMMRISAEGKVVEDIPLVEVFKNSHKLGLLTLTGDADPKPVEGTRPGLDDREIFHLNDVEELPDKIAKAFPMFKAGDLLVSLRNRNLLLVIDRGTKQIKWWQIGPWVRQHDPDWDPDGTITVFDNHRDGTDDGKILGGSRIVAVNPATSQTQVIYGRRKGEFFYSIRRGNHQNLGANRMLINEAEAGRVFEIGSNKQIVWDYVNRYDNTHTALVSGATAYGAKYFSVNDWTCPAN